MRFYFTLLFLGFFIIIMTGQNSKTLELRKPNKQGGMPIMKAFSLRSSDIEFDSSALKIEDLSNLLWAANGINRPESQKRTAPSALNAQEVDIYVFNELGVYLYDAKNHKLQVITEGDQRNILGEFKSKETPASILLLVSDISTYRFGDDKQRLSWGALDAGMITQNILLFCSANKLLSRPRTSMDKNKVINFLNLKNSQHPMINILVSYEKQ